MDGFNSQTFRRRTVWVVLGSLIILLFSSYLEVFQGLRFEFNGIQARNSLVNDQVKFDPKPAEIQENERSSKPISASTAPEIVKYDDDYVAICMSVRNQSLDLPEFLHHHFHHLKIRHFYIQDDGTTPPLSSTTNLTIPSSSVTFTYYPRETILLPPNQKFQPFAYEECNRNFGHKHTWIAYLDTDEFLEMTRVSEKGERETLQEFLRTFEANKTIGAIAANWKVHTSSSHLTRQPSVRRAYTTCITSRSKHDNRFIKSIVKTSAFSSSINPHWFYLKPGFVTVGEEGDLVEEGLGWRRWVGRERIAVHHFATKSREEFGEKVERGSGMGVGKRWGWWDYLHAVEEGECREMVRYAEMDEDALL